MSRDRDVPAVSRPELTSGGRDVAIPNDERKSHPSQGVGSLFHDLGVRDIKLLTNNPRKVIGLEGCGLRIVERVPIQRPAGDHNRDYLQTKKAKLGHLLDEIDTGVGD